MALIVYTLWILLLRRTCCDVGVGAHKGAVFFNHRLASEIMTQICDTGSSGRKTSQRGSRTQQKQGEQHPVPYSANESTEQLTLASVYLSV